LSVPASADAGDVSPALSGRLVWLPERGRIYESTNGGASWTTVLTTVSVMTISLIDPSSAIGVSATSGCRQYRTDCYSDTYLVATTDGGRTWHTI
jgi:photosystem II stability/assembly factor-like uncharacterized protein